MASRRREGLTSRQIEILTCIAKGHTTRECASMMEISLATARVHSDMMRLRLGARTLAHAVALGVEYGYIDLNEVRPQDFRRGGMDLET